MNKRYEEGRKPFFSKSGEKFQKQYVWTKDEKGQEVLQETEPIDIQQEIESYADECDIKNIVRKASFDPQFMKSLSQGALNGTEVDITEFPQNIHEYHHMIATAQANAMKLEELKKKAKEKAEKEPETKTKEKEEEE
jgi:ribosomal protein L12E/L44/L45/RPP1/RPP2